MTTSSYEIPKRILHLHAVAAGGAFNYAISNIEITSDGKEATAAATNGHVLLCVTWPCAESLNMRLPASVAKKCLSLCRTDTAKEKDCVTASIDGDMVTIAVTRKAIRKGGAVVIGAASVSGFATAGNFPDWRSLWSGTQPVVEAANLFVMPDSMSMTFATLARIAGKGAAIRCEFTAAHKPIRVAVAKDVDGFVVKGMMMPCEVME